MTNREDSSKGMTLEEARALDKRFEDEDMTTLNLLPADAREFGRQHKFIV
jgi:hypothetical protein